MTIKKTTRKKSYPRNKKHYNRDPLAFRIQYHDYTGKGYPNITNDPNEVNCSICLNAIAKYGL